MAFSFTLSGIGLHTGHCEYWGQSDPSQGNTPVRGWQKINLDASDGGRESTLIRCYMPTGVWRIDPVRRVAE